jgi:hypothetical protein
MEKEEWEELGGGSEDRVYHKSERVVCHHSLGQPLSVW